MIGDEHQLLARLGVFETDSAQRFRVSLLGIEDGQGDRVLADHSGAPIGLALGESPEAHTLFGTGHEERAGLIESREAFEVHIAAIDDVEGTGLGNKLIEDVDVVELAVAALQESRDIPAQGEQCVERHRRFGRAQRCPRKQRQVQIDGRRVDCVDCIGQLDSERLVRIELGRHRDEPLCKLGVAAPIAHGVSIGQRAACKLRPKSHVIELLGPSAKSRIDVAQTLPKAQLRKDNDEQLLEEREALDFMISFVTCHTVPKCCQQKVRGQLREDQLPGVQRDLDADEKSAPLCRIRRSNRDQIK